MSAYTNKRAAEKGARNLEPTDQQKAAEKAEKNAYQQQHLGEVHVVVFLDEKTEKFWRLSRIKQEPRKFCREARLPYNEEHGLNSTPIQTYIQRNTRQPSGARA